MQQEEFISIVKKFETGACTQEELIILQNYCEEMQRVGPPPEWNLDEEKLTSIRILASINTEIDQFDKVKHHPKRSIGIWWRVAAILVLFSGMTIWLSSQFQQEKPIEYVTKKTERGQKSTVKLPDGTEVKLNSESSITYRSDFTELEYRNVHLSGEAFFKVVENEKRPFTVNTDQLNTTVLGTTFNVNAYPNSATIQVTLATGKVKVSTNQKEGIRRSFEINPGEQISFLRSSREMHKNQVNLEKYISWVDGTILFEENTMEESAKILERWYDVNFEFGNEDLKQCKINGEFRNDNLENILKNLEFLTDLEFTLDNRIVYVTGSACKNN